MSITSARREVRESSPPHLRDAVAELAERRAEAMAGPGDWATAAQRAKGKLPVRERLDLLFDPGSFTEVEALRRHRASGFGLEDNRPHSDGVITGWGEVHGRTVFAYAHDFRIFGGSLGEAHAQKIHKIIDMAESAGAPIVGLCDGAGARIQEGVTALAGYGGIFQRNVRCSGVIPQISVVLGPCAGGAAYSPALTDFTFMVAGTAQMYVTGPDVIHAVTGASVTQEALGGAEVHATLSGLAAFTYRDEPSCLEDVRYLLSLLPANNREMPPAVHPSDPAGRVDKLTGLVPADARASYDMREVIEEIVDDGEHLELHASGRPTSSAPGPARRARGRHRGQPAALRGGRAGQRAPARRRPGSCRCATRSTSRW